MNFVKKMNRLGPDENKQMCKQTDLRPFQCRACSFIFQSLSCPKCPVICCFMFMIRRDFPPTEVFAVILLL